MKAASLERPPYATGLENRRLFAKSIRRLCEIPEDISVTDFAERHRMLPESSTSEGPYDPSIIPYARRPQDLTADPRVSMIVLCWGAQMTKSTLIENALMYRICRMPSPMVIVHPKIGAAEAWSKERFRPMIRATPLLRSRVPLGRMTESTLRFFKFAGGFAFVASAQSAAELAQRSSPFLFFDEVERMEILPGEGNPVEIGLRRQGAADIGLAILTSTPGDADSTIIWPYLESGTYEFYCLPCPHCGFRQPLVWSNLRFDRDSPSSAHYVCAGQSAARKMLEKFDRVDKERRARIRAAAEASAAASGETWVDKPLEDESWRTKAFDVDRFAEGGCGTVIEETDKMRMLTHGKWFATNPDADYPSFHLNSLYSPFRKSNWPTIVGEWNRSEGKPADQQVFINTRLAELWEDTKDVTDPNSLINRLDPALHEGIVPRGVGVLTAGVDVQHNRIEAYVWGWGAGLESWLIASAVFPGDPQNEYQGPGSVWAKLDEWLMRPFAHVDSNGIEFVPISVAFVDSGDLMTQVYRFTNQRRGRQIFASKGVGGDGQPLVGKPSAQGKERVVMYTVGTDAAKNEFIRSQLLESQHGPGYVHLGAWVTVDQCKQLVSEKRKRHLAKGRVVWYWAKKSETDPNEALDCRNYARSSLEALGTGTILGLGDAASALAEQAVTLAGVGNQPTHSAQPVSDGSGRRVISRGFRSDS